MRSYVIVAFLLCIVAAVLCEDKTCEKQEDCDEDECCVQIHSFTNSKCKKRRENGLFCFPYPGKYTKDGKYRLMCPCMVGLECKAEKIEEDDGSITYLNAKCQEPEKV